MILPRICPAAVHHAYSAVDETAGIGRGHRTQFADRETRVGLSNRTQLRVSEWSCFSSMDAASESSRLYSRFSLPTANKPVEIGFFAEFFDIQRSYRMVLWGDSLRHAQRTSC
jgi:hypothetical protein